MEEFDINILDDIKFVNDIESNILKELERKAIILNSGKFFFSKSNEFFHDREVRHQENMKFFHFLIFMNTFLFRLFN